MRVCLQIDRLIAAEAKLINMHMGPFQLLKKTTQMFWWTSNFCQTCKISCPESTGKGLIHLRENIQSFMPKSRSFIHTSSTECKFTDTHALSRRERARWRRVSDPEVEGGWGGSSPLQHLSLWFTWTFEFYMLVQKLIFVQSLQSLSHVWHKKIRKFKMKK